VTFTPHAIGSRPGTLTIVTGAGTQVVPLSGSGSVSSLLSVAISPANPTLLAGTQGQLAATGTFPGALTLDLTTSSVWTSSSPGVASVGSATGTLTAVASGSATVTAAVTGTTIKGTTTVTVPAPSLTAITVTPGSVSLGLNGTQQFTATGTYSDGSSHDITGQVTWTSGTPTVVSITATGLATVLQTSATAIPIQASQGTITSAPASVSPPPPATLTAITVTPGGVSLGLNGTQQFTATGTYSDGSSHDITAQALWNSGAPSEVSISSSGLATVLQTSSTAIPIQASQGTITSAPAWLSALSSLPVVCTTPSIDMRLLVINDSLANGGAGYADFPAIQQILDYVGTPYTVIDTSSTTPTLSDGNCHGYYQGVIFAFGGDIYTLPWMPALTSYEQTFHVRQVNWFMYPDNDFGFNYPYTGTLNDTQTDSATFTAAGASVFSYANTNTPLQISNAFVYLGTPLPSPGATPLLQDTAGNTLSLIYDFGDGRQYLTQTFDTNPWLMHDLVLAYGLLNWVTQGLFLGEYHVYASAQVDDFFIDDSEWVPGTPCTNPITKDRTPPDASFLPTVRVTAADMAALVARQSAIQADPLLSQFKISLAMNGVGTSGNNDWTGLPKAGVQNDTLVTQLAQYQQYFHWMSHTYDHPGTLNGLHQSDVLGDPDSPQVDDIDLEILTNLWTATGLSPGVNLDTDPSDSALTPIHLTDFNPANLVTPGVTGLNDLNVPGFLYADGIRYVVTDTSVIGQPNNGPNPSPNVGLVNSYATGLYEVPRHPNDVFFNAANWNDDAAEFDCIYTAPSSFAGYTGPQILDFTSSTFLTNMLVGDMDPEMFHQPNLVAYDGVHSLITDTYEQTFAKYEAVYKLPVLSPTLDQEGQAMMNRNAYNQSGVTATLVGAYGPSPTVSVTVSGTAATIPITGMSGTGAESYGPFFISHVPMQAGETVVVPLK
jgi:hypothetical protein